MQKLEKTLEDTVVSLMDYKERQRYLINKLFQKLQEFKNGLVQVSTDMPIAIETSWLRLHSEMVRQMDAFDEKQCGWHTQIRNVLEERTSQMQLDVSAVRQAGELATQRSLDMIQSSVAELETFQSALHDRIARVDDAQRMNEQTLYDVRSRQNAIDRKLQKSGSIGPLLQSARRNTEGLHEGFLLRPGSSSTAMETPSETDATNRAHEFRATYLAAREEGKRRFEKTEFQSLQGIIADAQEAAYSTNGQSLRGRIRAAQRVASRSSSRESTRSAPV